MSAILCLSLHRRRRPIYQSKRVGGPSTFKDNANLILDDKLTSINLQCFSRSRCCCRFVTMQNVGVISNRPLQMYCILKTPIIVNRKFS